MQVELELEKQVLVLSPNQDILLLIRDFLEPLGYSVEFAPEVSAACHLAE